MTPPRALRASAAIAAFFLSAALSSTAGADVFYVNVGLVGGLNDGSSWENAFNTEDGVSVALFASSSGDEIWVAAGTYVPTSGTSRNASVILKSGVTVYGGFAGDERTLDQRDVAANVTVLSGDLSGNDPANGDNSYHVVRGTSGNSAALDGFTITGGNANGPQSGDRDRGGGAILISGASNVFRQCTFVGNRCTFGGGAVYVRQSSPSFTDCRFEDNLGGAFGGAFDIFNAANPSFERCQFIGNSAARAGAIEAFGNCQPTVRNCVIQDNTSTGGGGGGAFFIATGSQATIRNTSIVSNHANVQVGGILNNGSTVSLGNVIIWNNSGPGGSVTAAQQVTNQGGGSTSSSYGIIQFGFAGSTNSGADPMFVDLAAGDLRLAPGSPAIDSGNNGLVLAGTTEDADRQARFVDDPDTPDTGVGTPPIVDRGAYEFQADSGCPADLTGDGMVEGADLGILLGGWGGDGPADLDGSGVVDGGDLGILLGDWGPCS